MITIAFYSYKGGVGRSLALANLAIYLAQFGLTVAMIDFDIEAPGLHYKLHTGDKPIAIDGRGLAGLLADVSTGSEVTDHMVDIAIDVTEHVQLANQHNRGSSKRGKLLLVPAGDSRRPSYWHDVSQIDWDTLFSSPERPGVTAMSKLTKHLEERHRVEVLLIDSRTGITASGGVATTLLPNVVVPFMIGIPEHLDGTRLVIQAVLSDQYSSTHPRVVPVLSRYVEESVDELSSSPEFDRAATESKPTSTELERVYDSITEGVEAESRQLVSRTLVLHSDDSLQQHEYLSFGPSSKVDSYSVNTALLNDYLRLFANLVPRDLIVSHIPGIRDQAREIVLDRPDDAVRTLEYLVGLTGDLEVFADLIKLYVLRRDLQRLLVAADRLYSSHSRLLIDERITEALRDYLLQLPTRITPSTTTLSGEFVAQYWWEAALDDAIFGVLAARYLTARSALSTANSILDAITEREYSLSDLTSILRMLADGSDNAEQHAVLLALKNFAFGSSSRVFLSEASRAATFQRDVQLASLISSTRAFWDLDIHQIINILRIAGRIEEATAQLVEFLGDAHLGDIDPEDFEESWSELIGSKPNIKGNLDSRNPAMVEYFDRRYVRDHRRSPSSRPN